MKKEDYIKYTNKKLFWNKRSKKIMLDQIERFYKYNHIEVKHNYIVGDDVFLKEGTLLHGTYKNIEGLRHIVKTGLISYWFIDGRLSKYPPTVGVWNLQKDYYLKDYINFYSGGTIEYKTIDGKVIETDVIPYDKINNIMKVIDTSKCFRWFMEQTKEARFMPSLVQDKVQIAIIMNGSLSEMKDILKGDILTCEINDKDVKPFINPNFYNKFIKDRKHKDAFFTDRESAILFGIPSSFIEGILVGREYEKDSVILNEIKDLLPNSYICNLDGKVIYI